MNKSKNFWLLFVNICDYLLLLVASGVDGSRVIKKKIFHGQLSDQLFRSVIYHGSVDSWIRFRTQYFSIFHRTICFVHFGRKKVKEIS